ncbi:MAG: oligosaccharide flippase family protein, partial [Patescibacteria group bacterium]
KLIFSKTAKDTAVIMVGNSIAAILAVLFTIFAARSLGPDGWGIVTGVISFVTIVEAFGDFGLGSSLFRFISKEWSEGNREKAKRILDSVFLLRTLTAVVTGIILIFLSKLIAEFIFHTNDTSIVLFATLAVCAYLFIDFQIATFLAKQRWKTAALFLTLGNGIRFVWVWILSQGNPTVMGILFAFSASPLLAFLISLAFQPVSIGWHKKETDFFKTIIPFSGWVGINRIASATIARMDAIIMLSILGSHDTGIYGAARQLSIGIPIVLGSVASVLAPRFATLTGSALTSYFKKSLLLSTLLSLGVLAGIYLAPWIINFFGPKYKESLPVLQWLLAGFIPFVFATPAVNALIYSYKKPRIIALIASVQLPIIIVAYYLLTPRVGILGPAYIHVAWHLTTMILSFVFVAKYLKR